MIPAAMYIYRRCLGMLRIFCGVQQVTISSRQSEIIRENSIADHGENCRLASAHGKFPGKGLNADDS